MRNFVGFINGHSHENDHKNLNFFLPEQFYFQLQHLHYLQYWYDTNIYTYNILTNYTTYTYTTYTCTTLQYDTKKKNLEKYETTNNTMLMLLRKILVL